MTQKTEFLSYNQRLSTQQLVQRVRRREWAGGKGRGMWELQWLIAWMPPLYNSIPGKTPVVEVDPRVTVQM